MYALAAVSRASVHCPVMTLKQLTGLLSLLDSSPAESAPFLLRETEGQLTASYLLLLLAWLLNFRFL